MRTLTKFLAGSCAALAVALATPQAGATLLPPNTTVVPNAQTDPLTGTTIVANTGVEAYSATLNGETISGTVQEWVVRNYAGNPFGASNLTFVYIAKLTGGSTATGGSPILERVAAGGYTGFSTDVGYNLTSGSAGTVVPFNVDRSSTGSVVGFNFTPPGANILLGQGSALLIINTDAPNFVPGTITVQDGIAANAPGFSPAAVPEPNSAVLLGCSVVVLGLGVVARRRLAPA